MAQGDHAKEGCDDHLSEKKLSSDFEIFLADSRTG